MRISSQQSAKMKTKTAFVYTAFAVAVVAVVCTGLFFYLNLGNSEKALAAGTFSSTATGNWATGTTWVGGVAPVTTGLNGDNITINSPHTVTAPTLTVNNNVTITIKVGATLYISGNLIVNNNLILNNSGTLIITGSLTANNNSNVTINGGGVAKISGAATFNNNATLVVNGSLEAASISFGNNESFRGTGIVKTSSGCAFWAGPGTCSAGTLPVKLINFTAENVQGSIVLQWKTASEENNEYFTVERTSDGINYKPIVTIPGAGTTLKASSYSYEDLNPLSGKSYYRLSQTDYDGKSETFQHISVDVEEKAGLDFKIFPNPLKGTMLNVAFINGKEGFIEVLNIKGDKVASSAISNDEQSIQLTLPENLQPGFYYVNYKTASGVKALKLLKQ